jgi:transcriptional regulator with XRE-family HTH domain
MTGEHLVRESRLRARLTQAELAQRVGTTQSAIARWERGHSRASLETVRRIAEACGFDLSVRLTPVDPDLLAALDQNLAMTPTERLDQLARTARFVSAGREALARTP